MQSPPMNMSRHSFASFHKCVCIYLQSSFSVHRLKTRDCVPFVAQRVFNSTLSTTAATQVHISRFHSRPRKTLTSRSSTQVVYFTAHFTATCYYAVFVKPFTNAEISRMEMYSEI